MLAAQGAGAQSDPAATYCTQNGGVVQTRYPAFGTNGSNPLRLAGTVQFCQFTSADGSRINVRLETLYSQPKRCQPFRKARGRCEIAASLTRVAPNDTV